jgi:hypothetical protein
MVPNAYKAIVNLLKEGLIKEVTILIGLLALQSVGLICVG